jgi:hypothetical protein
MSRAVAVALLVLLPAVARADGGPMLPGYHKVPLIATLTVDRAYPDYVFFLVNWSGTSRVERLPVSPSEPVRLLPDGRIGAFRDWSVHAVPKNLLAPHAGPDPQDCHWFVEQKSRGVMGLLGPGSGGEPSLAMIDFGGHDLPFYDCRDRVEITYRIEGGPGGWWLVKVAENAGDPAVRRGWAVAGLMLAAGAAGLGLWVVRRMTRPRAA